MDSLLDDFIFLLANLIGILFIFSCGGLVVAKYLENEKWIKILETIIAIFAFFVLLGLIYLIVME